jgi:hypothetical protein
MGRKILEESERDVMNEKCFFHSSEQIGKENLATKENQSRKPLHICKENFPPCKMDAWQISYLTKGTSRVQSSKGKEKVSVVLYCGDYVTQHSPQCIIHCKSFELGIFRVSNLGTNLVNNVIGNLNNPY